MELDTPDSPSMNQFMGLQLLRIKRRRGDAPAEQLLVQNGSSSVKRAKLGSNNASQPVDDVATQLTKGLSLEQQSSQYGAQTDMAEDQQQANVTDSQTTIKRYIRVQTLNKDAFKELSADEARGLLQTWQQLAAQQETATPQSAAAGGLQAPVQYTVIRAKRHRTGIPDAPQHETATQPGHTPLQTQGAEADQDVLENLCNVIDIHAHGTLASSGPVSKRVKSESQPSVATSSGMCMSTSQQQQPSSEVEAALKSVFLPMLDDYLSHMGNGITSVLDARQTPPQENSIEPAATSQHHYKQPSRRPRVTPSTIHSAATQTSEQQPVTQPSQQTSAAQDYAATEISSAAKGGEGLDRKGDGALNTEDDSEQFMYDVYIPVGEAPMELGTSNPANLPIIELPDSDDEMYWAMQEQPGSKPFDWLGHDSEDSNAESYFANSYPDEEDAEQEDEYDFGDYSGHRQPSRQAWGEEEFDVNDYDSSEAADDDLEPVARSRKIAQTLLHTALSKRKTALQ